MPRPERGPGLLLAAAAAVGALATPARAEPALRPEPLGDDEYMESFSFVADLDDGTYVQLQLGVTNLGPGRGTGFCRALVRRPGSRPWSASERFGHRWGHVETGRQSERLEVGSCFATSGPAGTLAQATLSGRSVELSYPSAASPRDPPAVDLEVGGRTYRSWILQAFTPVSARFVGLGAPGPLAGGGYADHSRSNVRSRDLARSWVRFRSLRGDRPLLLLGRQAPDGSWEPAWLWRMGERAVKVAALQVARATAAGSPGFTVTLAVDGVGSRIASVSPLYRYASLSELGPLGRVVAPWVGNSVTYTQRATLSHSGEGPIDGILEVSVFEE
jgi:hypothetical protein